LSYCDNDTSGDYSALVAARLDSGGNDTVYFRIYRDVLKLAQRVSGVTTTLDTETVDSTEGTWYDVRMVCDASNVNVWRAERGSGEPMELVLTTTSCNMTTSSYVAFWPQADADFSFDNVVLLANSLARTAIFAYDTSDRMTQMTKDSMTTAFYYDFWGRQISKNAQGGAHTASYTYRYDSKMCTASISFPDESNLTLSYDGLGKLRQSAGAATNKYRWDAGWNLINIEGGDGTLQKTVWYQAGQAAMAPLGMAAGTNPSSGATWSYFLSDHINSIRSTRNDDRVLTGEYEYTPYGNDYFRNGPLPEFGFTAKRRFDQIGQYYFPYRMYSPGQARWLMRDPAGMADGPNVYGYSSGQPIMTSDPLGLCGVSGRRNGCRYGDYASALWSCGAGIVSSAGAAVHCTACAVCVGAIPAVAGFGPLAWLACIRECALCAIKIWTYGSHSWNCGRKINRILDGCRYPRADYAPTPGGTGFAALKWVVEHSGFSLPPWVEDVVSWLTDLIAVLF
jgi:RHS repeat-associated protein